MNNETVKLVTDKLLSVSDPFHNSAIHFAIKEMNRLCDVINPPRLRAMQEEIKEINKLGSLFNTSAITIANFSKNYQNLFPKFNMGQIANIGGLVNASAIAIENINKHYSNIANLSTDIFQSKNIVTSVLKSCTNLEGESLQKFREIIKEESSIAEKEIEEDSLQLENLDSEQSGFLNEIALKVTEGKSLKVTEGKRKILRYLFHNIFWVLFQPYIFSIILNSSIPEKTLEITKENGKKLDENLSIAKENQKLLFEEKNLRLAYKQVRPPALNIREKPNPTSKIVDTLYQNDLVIVILKANKSWRKISYKSDDYKVEGYVLSKYLRDLKY
ncbi:SH3 domain-containing protein [Candidatus Haliotispira prima]|uniref:SH3 domain-containing protein n=1 Tax=Candidatus Haliotispira prima TaxID=3034016 RepID=A0ABY8MEF5_9SPIO|nr:SH3 domain-containing protein [Candidatus Haliotispira prima]